MATLTGTVDRLVFRSPDDEYAVARFRVEDVGEQRTYDDLATIVGSLGGVAPGELLRVGGEWERHPKHGRHFRVHWLEHKLPATAAGIERFLGSGVIKGIGPTTAQRIVAHFGETTIDVIENHPDQLRQVPKMSRKRVDLIVKGWQGHRQVGELMLFLQSHNLPGYLAKRLQDQYGDQCVAVIQQDPYQLVQDVYGIGFKTADEIAVNLGLSRVSTSRFVAGIRQALNEASREGNVYLPKELLLDRAAILLGVSAPQLEPALLEASRQGMIIFDDGAVYPTPLYHAERNCAQRLHQIHSAQSFIKGRLGESTESAAKKSVASLGISLAPRQLAAVAMALREKVSIITGGPGTGKTMCLHAVISALDSADIPYSLCAPTGRAAKRMTAATGRPAFTIHRLLGYQPSGNEFAYNADNQLQPQVFIIDEVSMLDTVMFNHALKAIPDEAHLLLVGDADQLPSIGAGNVLRDLLASDTIAKVTLTELFRQAENSSITTVAHQIRRGEVPANASGGDLYMIKVDNGEGAQAVINEMVTRRIPARFKLDPMVEIQVLSPTHRGPAGVSALNDSLQSLLNPVKIGIVQPDSSQLRFRQGDKVMQVRNNYDKDIFNGDVGTVAAIDREAQVISVRYGELDDFRDVDYGFAELGDLILAYAVSVHKSQGSEFPCVVMPLLASHYRLLQRNLLYTAITRAQRLCVLVYQPKALAMAVSSDTGDRRFTNLANRLRTISELDAMELLDDPLE